MALHPTVYIEANRPNGMIYVGTTGNLPQRHQQHIAGTASEFTAKHKIKTLVWYELHATMASAIARESQLKNWSRAAKVALILKTNPQWADLSFHLQDM